MGKLRVIFPQLLGNEGAKGRVGDRAGHPVAGVHEVAAAGVISLRRGQAPNEAGVFCLLGELGVMLRDLEAARRVDPLGLAAVSMVGFRIPGIELAGAAAEPDKDAILGLALLPGRDPSDNGFAAVVLGLQRGGRSSSGPAEHHRAAEAADSDPEEFTAVLRKDIVLHGCFRISRFHSRSFQAPRFTRGCSLPVFPPLNSNAGTPRSSTAPSECPRAPTVVWHRPSSSSRGG